MLETKVCEGLIAGTLPPPYACPVGWHCAFIPDPEWWDMGHVRRPDWIFSRAGICRCRLVESGTGRQYLKTDRRRRLEAGEMALASAVEMNCWPLHPAKLDALGGDGATGFPLGLSTRKTHRERRAGSLLNSRHGHPSAMLPARGRAAKGRGLTERLH